MKNKPVESLSIMFKKIKYGASIHPGNGIYVVVLVVCFFAGMANESAPWWFGMITYPLWGALYVWTSYEVGKANWPPETRSPKE